MIYQFYVILFLLFINNNVFGRVIRKNAKRNDDSFVKIDQGDLKALIQLVRYYQKQENTSQSSTTTRSILISDVVTLIPVNTPLVPYAATTTSTTSSTTSSIYCLDKLKGWQYCSTLSTQTESFKIHSTPTNIYPLSRVSNTNSVLMKSTGFSSKKNEWWTPTPQMKSTSTTPFNQWWLKSTVADVWSENNENYWSTSTFSNQWLNNWWNKVTQMKETYYTDNT